MCIHWLICNQQLSHLTDEGKKKKVLSKNHRLDSNPRTDFKTPSEFPKFTLRGCRSLLTLHGFLQSHKAIMSHSQSFASIISQNRISPDLGGVITFLERRGKGTFLQNHISQEHDLDKSVIERPYFSANQLANICAI